MADPQTVLPYHDPFEAQYSEDIFCILDNRNPTLEELSIQEPFPDPTSIPQQGTGIGSSNDPFENGGIWHVKNDPNTGNSQAGPSEIHVESSHGNQTNFHAGSSYFEDSILLSEWPPTPIPFGCSCCQVLREIIHTNGNEVTTLEIHGRVGMIFHAVLEVQLNMETLSPSYHHQMFDFCKKSLEEVKQFLVQYCLERRQAGFFVISDPFSVFYEALCVGFFWTENQYCDEFNPPPSSNLEELQGSNKAEDDNNEQPRVPKTSLSEQRQRTGKITLKEIGNYFHLPIEEAAKKMRLCPTVVKKICRRDGLARWPHRKIKSMERQISYWAGLLSSNDPEGSARAQNEILRLQQEIENIRQGAVGSR